MGVNPKMVGETPTNSMGFDPTKNGKSTWGVEIGGKPTIYGNTRNGISILAPTPIRNENTMVALNSGGKNNCLL